MKKIALVALLCVAPTANAGVYGDALGKCMASAATTQDKQELVEWIFAAISLNPAIAPYSDISVEQRDAFDRNMARIVERLIGESCAKEAREALEFEGAEAFGVGFQLLGQVAGTQIFGSPEVAAGSQSFQQYLDLEKLQEKLDATAGTP